MNKEKRLIMKFINNICEKDYFIAKESLSTIINEKINVRIKEKSNTKK